ncbi:hypothetical protein ACFQ6Q_08660 [Streptomyces sp. NPDC056437]|uniref:hypothetical protein n=1 Tax=Streptomyces sp. NPDC056437 TaxID=3345816 RepID=UPI00369D0908
MTTAAPVAEYGTDLQLTRVLHDPGGGFLWWHLPGPLAARPLTAPLAPLVPHLGPETGAALAAVAEPYGDGLLHRAAGSASLAAWLRDPRPQARRLAAHSLVSAARTLRAVHRVRVPGPPRIPPGLRRLGAWIAGDQLPDAAGRLRELARDVWGERRTARLASWADDAARGTHLVHGWASVGALIPPLSRGRVALLTGEDLAVGRPELDLGWMLGDLVELAWAMPYFGNDDLRRGFLDAYGPGPDPVAVGRCAVLRVATHMQDFATYGGWSDELHGYLDFTAELIDEEGRRAVPQGES